MRFKHGCASLILLSACIWLLPVLFPLTGEEVGKFAYKGFPEYLDGRTIQRPDDIVALCESIPAFDSVSSFSSGGATSIMLVIDNSTSMFINLPDNSDPIPNDPDGVRYEVADALLDEIYKKSPTTEVGMSIFATHLYFDPGDDALIEEIQSTEYSLQGGYIPLLKLNEDVTVGNNSGMTGYEVLKEYLKVKNYTHTYQGIVNHYTNLVYLPSNASCDPLKVNHSGTNIWGGYQGVKEAMQNSSHTKENQYVIFLSDGEHLLHSDVDAGPHGFDWDDITAENAPTTFCVYIDPDDQITFPIEDFIECIQNNGYSANNPNSSFKQIQAGFDVIMNYLSSNVISQIITNLTQVTPKTCIVNGVTCPNPWADDAFMFDDLFALQNPSADFNYRITYGREEIIISGNDTTINPLQDTTVDINFTAHVSSGEDLGDSLELTFWGRNLDLFYNGTEIGENDVITDDMKDLEIRFESYRVDTLYDYQNMKIEVTHVQGSDKETFTLEDKGTYWAYTFPRTTGSANAGDNTLQHQNPDSIVLTFRNPDLPLDTLRVARYYYDESSGIKVTEGIYFDNTADGKVDSIFLAVTGDDFGSYVDAIMSNIELPAHRNFSVGSYSAVSDGIAVPVTENASATLTYITAEDVVTIDSVELADDVILLKSSFTFIDSMAPVIMTADLVDSADLNARDELTVVFSEDIESITENQPCRFYKTAGGTEFDATLQVLSQSGTQAVFEVTSISGASAIVQGDSIRINAAISDKIRDTLGNKQDNPENIRREINVKVVEKGMAVEYGIYFDNDANGYIDSIFVGISGKKVDEHVDDLQPLIELPAARDFTVTGYRYSTGGIALDVSEENQTIKTYVTDDEIIRITTEKVFPDGESVIKSEARAVDSLAPVIVTANLVDSLAPNARDELTIIFSENVEAITREKPFEFFGITNNAPYFAILSVLSQNADSGIFEVRSLEGVSEIVRGDSVRIYWSYDSNVHDGIGNNQDNPKNRRVPISIEYIPVKYDLLPDALILDEDSVYSLPSHFKDILNIGQSGADRYKGISVITLTPDDYSKVTPEDSLSGRISVYDAVGNPIIIDKEMGFDCKRTRLVYIWDGRNEAGRVVGQAAYVAIMPCKFYYRKGENSHDAKWSWTKRKVVGVRRK